MRIAIRQIPKFGDFTRNVAILASGTAIAQAIAVACLPLLTRIYGPADFELLATYTSLLGLLVVTSSLRYELAVPIPKDDRDGMALLIVALLFSALTAGVVVLPVALAPHWCIDVLGEPGIGPYLWMVPVGLLLASTYNALQFWTTRQRQFTTVARTRITQAVGGATTQVGLGVTSNTPFGLLFGSMVSQGLGNLRLTRELLRHDHNRLRQVTAARMRRNISIYRRFPLLSVPEALLNVAGLHVTILLIASMAAGPEAGFLLLAMKVVGIPTSLIGASVAQVFIAEAAGRLRDRQLSKATRQTMRRLLFIATPPLVSLGLLAPLLVPILFGAEWDRAGVLVAWLTPWFVLQFATTPVSVVFLVADRQGTALVVQLLGFALRFGAVVLAMETDAFPPVEAFAVTSAAFYAIYAVTALRCASVGDRKTVMST